MRLPCSLIVCHLERHYSKQNATEILDLNGWVFMAKTSKHRIEQTS